MLLVILGHCLDGYLRAGMFQSHTMWMQWLYNFLYSFHMPLFFLLSGFLYYYSYHDASFEKIKNKALNLIALYFAYSVMQCFIQAAMAGKINRQVSLSDIFTLPFYTVPPYWYLYVLFFLYIISFYLKPMSMYKFTAILLACIASTEFAKIELFDISSVAFYLMYFTLGGVIALFRLDFRFKKIYLLPLLAISVLIYCFSTQQGVSRILVATSLSFLCLVFFCTIGNFRDVKLFKLCGKYCLAIYLIHTYLTAGTRVFLKHFQCNSVFIYLAIGMISGIFVPILVYKICKKNKYLGQLFNPIKNKHL